MHLDFEDQFFLPLARHADRIVNVGELPFREVHIYHRAQHLRDIALNFSHLIAPISRLPGCPALPYSRIR